MIKASDIINTYTELGGVYRLLKLAETSSIDDSKYYLQTVIDISASSNMFYMYNFACQIANRLLGSTSSLSLKPSDALEDWETDNRESVIKQENLVAQAKHQGIKGSIRESIYELGDLYYSKGNPHEALKTYIRAKDVLTDLEEQCEQALMMAKASYFHNNFPYTLNQASKAFKSNSAVTRAKAHALAGLCYIKNKDYKYAFKELSQLNVHIKGELTEFFTSTDILNYCVIVGLASSDRDELQALTINKEFSLFLDEEVELKDIIDCYLACKYTELITKVRFLVESLTCDFNIGDVIQDALREIRDKMVASYIVPFKRIRIDKIAEVFGGNPEEVLIKLITQNKISGRIDKHNNVFQSKFVDGKIENVREVLRAGRKVLMANERLILKISMMRQGLILRS